MAAMSIFELPDRYQRSFRTPKAGAMRPQRGRLVRVGTTHELFLSVLVLGEIRRGAERLKKRDPAQARVLERWLILAVDQFADRLVHVDRWVAEEWGRIGAWSPVPPIDGLLAATAQMKDFTLVTRNVKDIARTGVRYLNPFEPLR